MSQTYFFLLQLMNAEPQNFRRSLMPQAQPLPCWTSWEGSCLDPGLVMGAGVGTQLRVQQLGHSGLSAGGGIALFMTFYDFFLLLTNILCVVLS